MQKLNSAARLYRRLGFRQHTDDGDAVTLLWTARPDGGQDDAASGS